MTVPSADGLRPAMEGLDLIFKRLSNSLDLMKLGQSGFSHTLKRASRRKSIKWLLIITLLKVSCFRKVKYPNNLQILGNGMSGLSVIFPMKRLKMLCKQQMSILPPILFMVVLTISRSLKFRNSLLILESGMNGSWDISHKKKHKTLWWQQMSI